MSQEVKAKKPRIEGKGNAKEINEHSSEKTKKKKQSKKHIVGKENEVTSPDVKSVKKKKKKQNPSSEESLSKPSD